MNKQPSSVEKYNKISNSTLFTTPITVYELLSAPYLNVEKIKLFTEMLSRISLIDFGIKTAEESASIQRHLTKNGQKINEFDVLIAGIAKINGLIMVTKDKDFKKISGLKVETY
ncbi:MAG: type II toxin-antitoxin system VapC family toxin [archaeon]|nr:type II toxin-antitoxin system VapC family toxin [archaeon]